MKINEDIRSGLLMVMLLRSRIFLYAYITVKERRETCGVQQKSGNQRGKAPSAEPLPVPPMGAINDGKLSITNGSVLPSSIAPLIPGSWNPICDTSAVRCPRVWTLHRSHEEY